MPDVIDFYPAAPANVPPRLTKPSRGYRVRVVVVLLSLFLFVALYVGLVAGSAYFCYWSFASQSSSGSSAGATRNINSAVDTVYDIVNAQNRILAVYNRAVNQVNADLANQSLSLPASGPINLANDRFRRPNFGPTYDARNRL